LLLYLPSIGEIAFNSDNCIFVVLLFEGAKVMNSVQCSVVSVQFL
jgi:hypothetical protein